MTFKEYSIEKAFVLLFLSLATCLQAQPQLSSANTPQSGSTYSFSLSTSPGISAGNSGSNILWDFSELSFSSETITTYYTHDSTYNAFPDFNYPNTYFDTSKYNLKSYHYLYQIEDDRFSIAYQIVPVTEYTPQACYVDITLYPLPIDFNDQLNDTWQCGAINLGERSIHADGYGTLILPDSTYTNVLRIYTCEKKEFQPSSPNPSAHYDTTWTNLYDWFSENSEVPIFSIRYYKKHSWSMGVQDVFLDTTITLFKGTTPSTKIQKYQEGPLHLTAYPNPAHDKFTVTCINPTSEKLFFKLTNLLGVPIRDLGYETVQKDPSIVKFSTSGLSSGIYLLHAISPGKREVCKIIISK